MTLKQLKGKTCQHDLATLREGPLENLWGVRGRAKYKKKYSRKGKLNEKKFTHAS